LRSRSTSRAQSEHNDKCAQKACAATSSILCLKNSSARSWMLDGHEVTSVLSAGDPTRRRVRTPWGGLRCRRSQRYCRAADSYSTGGSRRWRVRARHSGVVSERCAGAAEESRDRSFRAELTRRRSALRAAPVRARPAFRQQIAPDVAVDAYAFGGAGHSKPPISTMARSGKSEPECAKVRHERPRSSRSGQRR
jgi:hypothetical protein